MASPIDDFDEMVELLQENGYSVEEVWSFQADSAEEFTVGLEVEVIR